MNKKNLGYLIGALAVVILLMIFGFVKLSNNKGISENKLEKDVSEVASEYYTTRYYPTIPEPKTFLVDFQDVGLTLSLNTLKIAMKNAKNNAFTEVLANKLSDKNCSLDDSKVIIMPKSPFGVKDFSIDVELSCK